ncbi:unnamed protein product [Pieris macdunnoughi]|uniref:Uncharacterized protein n=1 Tax=Pieris macdunnoughi TaxID=345717 RepID=A0A821XW38_9NEOP|nr:unnamed protein product [Pieris macdunnoughi]
MQLITVDSFTNTTELCKGATEIASDKDLLWIMSSSRKRAFMKSPAGSSNGNASPPAKSKPPTGAAFHGADSEGGLCDCGEIVGGTLLLQIPQ